jgi:flavin-dependent thymidylate synthase
MRVVLAGYNVDREVLEALKRHEPGRLDVTPETLAAAYARISRNPKPVDELRAEARIEVGGARRSNKNIIFNMGHHSVAEHAVFNFDIMGVSRLAIEELEHFRLSSYTEKSQRYILLGDDFLVPEEVRQAGPAWEELFLRTVRAQNALYHALYKRLLPRVLESNKEMADEPGHKSVLEGWAKEDARYVVSLATHGQLGMTINARNLELLVRRFAAKRLAEFRELNERLYGLAREVAPSLLLFTEASPFDQDAYEDLVEEAKREEVAEFERSERARKTRGTAAAGAGDARPGEDEEAVRLVAHSSDADDRVLVALLFAASGLSFREWRRRAARMSPDDKLRVYKTAFRRMEFYDFPLREFEHADLTFELVVSASCFAQLKRHRMATMTSQRYDPALGVTVPPAVEDVGARVEFMDIVGRTNEAYDALRGEGGVGAAADYILTNAHKRRILLKVNVRELYHISRLREDATAQWEIRALAGRMSALAREVMPMTCLMLGGKDAYPELYERVFGARPAILPPSAKT